MEYRELLKAKDVLGLGERATRGEIKGRFRDLARRYHPDTGVEPDRERIREINAAHHLIMEYVGEYRFSFTHEEFLEQNPEERLREQFSSDGLWRT